MKNLTFTFLIIILLSHLSFSQLDSVYYKGPSSGSVTSGAAQNTDYFSDKMPFYGGDQFKIIPPIERIPDNRGDMINGWSESKLPELIYVEDSNSNPVESGNGEPAQTAEADEQRRAAAAARGASGRTGREAGDDQGAGGANR